MINRWLPLKGHKVPLNEGKSRFPADEFQCCLLHFQQVPYIGFSFTTLHIKKASVWEKKKRRKKFSLSQVTSHLKVSNTFVLSISYQIPQSPSFALLP